jgi:serine protease Do
VNQPTKQYDAEVVGKDARTDFALIKIKGAGVLPTVKLGESKAVQVGQWVAAFGNPYGHSFSVSKGIISAVGRQIRELNAVPFIQTDASINPGNSGGPLVNLKGEVIAVNSAIDARAQGIGFAIPIDEVKTLIPQLKEKGRVIRGYIGTAIDDISPRAMQALGLSESEGALIMDVMEGSPAARGGMQTYDVVKKFGDKKIENAQDLLDAVAETKIGNSASVEVIREGKKRTLTVKVAEPPEQRQASRRQRPESSALAMEELGIKLENYSDKLARDLKIAPNSPKGPIVTLVVRGSVAEASGLRAGDMILDVNQRKVSTVADVQKNLKPGSNVLRVLNGDQVSLVFLR